MDRENISLKLTKCKFAQREREWLGHKITSTGITPLLRKTEPKEALTPPQLNAIKIVYGSNHSLHKYLPASAESSAPLRPLLSKSTEYIWTSECQNAFENLKKQVSNIVELWHFDIHKDIRIVCDASHNRLDAVLEQLGPEGWRPISVASWYLNEAEKKFDKRIRHVGSCVGKNYHRIYPQKQLQKKQDQFGQKLPYRYHRHSKARQSHQWIRIRYACQLYPVITKL